MTKLKRGPIPGLPDSTLAECLFITAKRKAGKSYLQRLAFERALTKGLRTGWIDAMGIGWGITVAGDPKNLEKPIGPGFDVVVFGGAHGHVPLSPTAGAALGQKLAKATFSWVLDISGFKSKAERVRFMAAFMEAIYEFTSSQLLLFVDEIDLWAPQMVMDKQGPIMQLIGTMDEIVRRGRIKGLVVWMATQRPAVVNLSIRSQAECFIAMKTTAPQDIDAIMSWLKFHLKKENFQEQMARFPALHRGQGLVYMTEPEISISEAQFPLILTLDTMTPRSVGERAQSDKLGTKPDIAAITKELGDLEEKLKADDPAHLKAEIARLKSEVANKPAAAASVPAPKHDIAAIKKTAFDEGVGAGQKQSSRQIKALKSIVTKEIEAMQRKLSAILAGMAKNAAAVETNLEALRRAALDISATTSLTFPELDAELAKIAAVVELGAPASIITPKVPAPTSTPKKAAAGSAPIDGLTRPQQKVLDALGWWKAAGHDAPTREQIAAVADYSPSSGGFNNLIGQLVTAGLIELPRSGRAALSDAGIHAVAIPGDVTTEDLHRRIQSALTAPQWKVLNAAITMYPDPITREQLAADTEYSASSGGFNNLIGSLNTLEMLTKPATGQVRAADWLFI